MLTIQDGATVFTLEEGQVVDGGWIFVRAELQNADYVIGTHLFVFQRDQEIRRILNEQWPGEQAVCTDGAYGIYPCPIELVRFSWRTTRVVQEKCDRQAARTED